MEGQEGTDTDTEASMIYRMSWIDTRTGGVTGGACSRKYARHLISEARAGRVRITLWRHETAGERIINRRDG